MRETLRRSLKAILLIALLLFPGQIRATTVVVFIAPNGVVISSDSKTVKRDSAYQATGELYQAKQVVLQNRIVVAAIGTSDIKDPIHHSHYNFLAWIHALRATMPESISVDDAAELIERESSKTLAPFALGDSLKNGTILNETPGQRCESFAQFVIVGYQDGAPRVYKVQYDIDWQSRKFTGPTKVLLYPNANKSNGRLLRFGDQEAIQDLLNTKSYAYKRAMNLCPEAMTKVTSGQPPSISEVAALSEALVRIEESTNPDEVGGPVTSVQILPDGQAKELPLRVGAR